MGIYDFIFTKQSPQRYYRHIAFWGAYYLFSLLTYFHPFLEKTTFGKWAVVELVEVFVHVFTQVIFCYSFLYYLLPKFFQRKKYAQFTVGLLLLMVSVYWLSFLQQYFIFPYVHHFAGMQFMPARLLRYFTLISFISYYPISTGLALAITVLKQFYTKQKENQALSGENAIAELQLLKAQVHPHFLFNTLNNIYSFTLDQSLQAPQLVMNLSDTLHYMITECEADSVLLEKELKMIQDYVDLEKVRYGDRLNITVEINGTTSDKKIVPLLMIPFIENSFKHGSSKMLGDSWIELYIQVDEQVLHFSLANGKPAEERTIGKGGIGLKNVEKRLQLLYPGRHLLTVESTMNTFTVNMQVPLEQAAVRDAATDMAGLSKHYQFKPG